MGLIKGDTRNLDHGSCEQHRKGLSDGTDREYAGIRV